MPNASKRCRWDDIHSAERVAIANRRGGPDGEALAGLAISGGGIRSATFALGVLESLKDVRLLSKFHYLSTVSGGGYIGSWLSANCRRRPDWLTGDWTESIRYLRRYSNYLSPQVGFFSADTWSMVTIWLRNTILIQATVILAIACALILPHPLFAVFDWWPHAGRGRWLTVALFIFGIVGIAGNHWQLTAGAPFELRPRPGPDGQAMPRSWRPVDLLRAQSWKIGAPIAAGLFLLALLAMWLFEFDPFQILPSDISTGEALKRSGVASLIAALLVLSGFCLQPVAVRIVATPFLRKIFGRSDSLEDMPTQVNYTQGYVQFCVVVPLMSVALLVTAVMWAQAVGVEDVTSLAGLTSYSELLTQGWKFWPFHLAIVFVSFWLLSIFAITSRREPKRILVALLAPAAAAAALHALLAAIVLVFQWFKTYVGGEWMAFVWGPPFVAAAFVLSIVVLIGMLGRDSPDGVREWWSRLGAWLAIYAVAWMVIAVSAVYGPLWVTRALEQVTWKTFTGAAGWLATVAGGLMAGNSSSTGGKTEGVGAKAKDILARVAPFVFIAGVLLAVGYVLHLIIVSNGGTRWWEQGAAPLAKRLARHAGGVSRRHAAPRMACRHQRVQPERVLPEPAGPRLPRRHARREGPQPAELHRLRRQGRPAARRSLPVETLNGPLHVVNCALNLGGSSDLALHTRHSASFTMSPASLRKRVHVPRPARQRGGDRLCCDCRVRPPHRRTHAGTGGLGVRRGGQPEHGLSHVGGHRLPADRCSTSGSAGGFRIRCSRPLMAPCRRTSACTYLVTELFGMASDKSSFVMVSDGGHFENMAVYELIRRQCRVIVISDGECDVDYTFGGLGTLIRVCEVDFGCRITINVDALRPTGESKWSTRRFAVGDIVYQGRAALASWSTSRRR